MEAHPALKASNYWNQFWLGKYFLLPGGALGQVLVGQNEMAQWVKGLLSEREEVFTSP